MDDNRWSVVRTKDKGIYFITNPDGIPISEVARYLKSLAKGISENTKEGYAYALMYWFEFLDHKSIHFTKVETRHILEFKNWINSPKESRNSHQLYLYIKPAIENSTWNQYYSKIKSFYENWVKPKYPNCTILFSYKNEHIYLPIRHKDKSVFTSNINEVDPKARYIERNDFESIMLHTNNRNKLIFKFMLNTGIRIGELFNIDKNQFLDSNKLSKEGNAIPLRIHNSYSHDNRKQTKTGARDFIVPRWMFEKIRQYIMLYRAQNKKSILKFSLQKE